MLDQALDGRIHLVAVLRQRVAEPRGEVDAPVFAPGVGHLAGPAEVDLLDDRTGLGQCRRGRAHFALDLGVHDVVAEIHIERQSQPAHVARDWHRPVERRRLRQRVAIVVARGSQQKQPRVVDRAGERTKVVDRVPARRHDVERNTTEGGLQANQAAVARRDADRAAHVSALGERHAAGRDGNGRAARRATRIERRVPRIARRTPERAARKARVRKLGRRGLADHDRAGGV